MCGGDAAVVGCSARLGTMILTTTTTTDDEVPCYDDGENEEESAEYDGENECGGIVCTGRMGGVYG